MLVTLYALGIIAIPLATVATLLLVRRRQSSFHDVAVSFIIAAVPIFVVYSIIAPMRGGNPAVHCGLIICCVWALMAFNKNALTRWASFAAGMVLMVALVFLHDALTGNNWADDPSMRLAAIRVRNTGELKAMAAAIKDAAGGDAIDNPAGWVHALPIAALKAGTHPANPYRVEIGRAWHSWFTRLHPRRNIPQAFWYPGGKIADAADRIELRDAD